MVFVEFQGKSHSYFIWCKEDFNNAFNGETFIRYAIRDLSAPEEELLPLDGVMPEIVEGLGGWYARNWSSINRSDAWGHLTPLYPTKPEAVRAWNEFVKRIRGEK